MSVLHGCMCSDTWIFWNVEAASSIYFHYFGHCSLFSLWPKMAPLLPIQGSARLGARWDQSISRNLMKYIHKFAHMFVIGKYNFLPNNVTLCCCKSWHRSLSVRTPVVSAKWFHSNENGSEFFTLSWWRCDCGGVAVAPTRGRTLLDLKGHPSVPFVAPEEAGCNLMNCLP